MLRCLAPGFLISALLLLLLPERAFACLPTGAPSWTKRTADGAIELSSRVGSNLLGPATLSLREVRSGKTLWEHNLQHSPHERQTHLSTSGRYVVLTDTFSAEFTLYGPTGEPQQLSLEPHLTASEKRKLPQSSCGQHWMSKAHFEGEVLVLDVPTAGMRPPIYGQPKGTAFYFDPKTRQLTREAPAPEKSTAELIQAYQQASDSEQRKRWLQELVERSMDRVAGSDSALSRFWQELLATPGTEPSLVALAVMGLGNVGTDEEVRGLARLPAGPPERDLEILQVLQRRAPQEAEAFGLRVLEERRQPEQLRARAVIFLSGREEAVAERAGSLALSDPSEKVREYGLEGLAREPLRAKAVERALPFCQAPEETLRLRAAESLRRILRGVRGTEREQALKVLSDANKRGQLKGFPEGYVILAGVADLEKKRSEALVLYRQGVQELEALPRERKWPTHELRLEAKLQLAFEAKAKKKEAELKKWAEAVLGDEHKHAMVCAPLPNEYVGTGSPGVCSIRRTAEDVARGLLEGGSSPKAR
ncbi:MAG TPA: hypothetical protein VF815_09105 [Myxococcaceae bacterium]|jgi:hypothetical protein